MKIGCVYMSHVLILGANGQIARQAIDLFLKNTNSQLTLYLRDARRLQNLESPRVRIIEGDVLDMVKLQVAMKNQDVVYANLEGEMDHFATNIIKAMDKSGVKRLIFIASLGIYDEVPGAFGEWNKREVGEYLGPYRKAADIIEASDLNYTIIRPAWLTDYDEIDYETTQKGEPFKGTEVSRKSVADLVVKIATSPDMASCSNLGINKPNTDGDKPAFI
jgi:uncharacterized protein YbjT (DUF2867 family)